MVEMARSKIATGVRKLFKPSVPGFPAADDPEHRRRQLKLFTTCAGKQDRLMSLGPLYFAIQDLLASWARVSSTRYTYRHT
jgi:hypothetical protein